MSRPRPQPDPNVVDADVVDDDSNRRRSHGFRERLRRLRPNRPSQSVPAGTGNIGSPSSLGSLIGTFIYVLVSTATLTNALLPRSLGGGIVGSLSVALAAGLAYAAGQVISSRPSQVNPADTLGKVLSGQQSAGSLLVIVAQIIGGLLASLLVWWMYGSAGYSDARLGAALPNAHAGGWLVFVIATVGTFVVVAAGNLPLRMELTAQQARLWSACLSGFAMAAAVLFTVNITGGSFDPARSIAPALWTWTFPLWYSILGGQFLGGFLGNLATRRR